MSLTVLLDCSGLNKVMRGLVQPDWFQKWSQRQLQTVKQLSPFLKVHLKNGELYVLKNWDRDSTDKHVIGEGSLLGPDRDTLRHGRFKIGIDSVALFETNILEQSPSTAGLTLMTGVSLFITAMCLSNPKACFGSCPTFYIVGEDSLRPVAEGFSASIAPALEATDIDALYHARNHNPTVEIEMRNEALETHVVRYVDLLALPKTPGNRVYADLYGNFWESDFLIPAAAARGVEGDCLSLLREADHVERYSLADSNYLGAKESIELMFDNIQPGQYGIVVACRQTLLSTYLLYQTFAYMGNNVGYWLAELERKGVKSSSNSLTNILGGIEVFVQNSKGKWRLVDTIKEYGPLAIDFHLISISIPGADSLNVRLRMTKGNWRVDYVALARLTGQVHPIDLKPYQVKQNGQIDKRAQVALIDSAKQLVTLPGDRYILSYRLPKTAFDYELFIQSRGYYLEWIREEWIAEENPYLLAQEFLAPRLFLRRLAPEFKQVEGKMEECFWNSRYARR